MFEDDFADTCAHVDGRTKTVNCASGERGPPSAQVEISFKSLGLNKIIQEYPKKYTTSILKVNYSRRTLE